MTTQTSDAEFAVIVIGSGVGGMAAATALSRMDRRVLLLEQAQEIGGLTHTFSRDGFTWDVGLHYCGSFGEDQPGDKVLDWLSDASIDFRSVGTVYDTIHFPDGFDLPVGRPAEAFKTELKERFPENAAEVNDPAAAVLELTGGGAQVSVDALGIQQTCGNAVNSLTKRGRHLQIGMTTGQAGGRLEVPIDDVINKELEIFGSKGMPAQNFPAMLRLVAAGRLDPGRLVTRTVPLEEAGAVLASMGQFDTLGFTVIDRF